MLDVTVLTFPYASMQISFNLTGKCEDKCVRKTSPKDVVLNLIKRCIWPIFNSVNFIEKMVLRIGNYLFINKRLNFICSPDGGHW